MSQPEKTRKSSAPQGNRATSLPPADASPPAPKREASGRTRKQHKTRVREAIPDKPTATLPVETHEQKTSLRPAASQPAASQPVPETVVRTLGDIPGLGPIRVRALEKAGMGSLSILRTATREQLLAVPGMSTIKADYIRTFMANATILSAEEAANGSASPARPDSKPIDIPGTPTRRFDVMTQAPKVALSWEQETARARGDVISLLTSPSAPDFRARLLRELVRFAASMPAWQTGLAAADDKAQERALRRLRRLQEVLTEALTQPELDRKMQSRLAEDFAEASDRLYAVSGQIEPVRKAEDTHD